MSDPNGVPFTVAPVRADDPKKKQQNGEDGEDRDGDGSKDKLANGSETATKQPGADGKEEEELVSRHRTSSMAGIQR